MTTAFYVPPSSMQGGRIVLPDDEARHAVRVLRKRAGHEVVVVDGEGGWHRVRLDQVGEDRAAGTVLETRRAVGEPPYQLSIGFGLIKNRNRFETFVEKAVELGVREIIPLHTVRTEKEGVKHKRTRNLMIAAMKQCGRTRLPSLTDPMALTVALETTDPFDAILVAHEQADATQSVRDALADVPETARILVLIGPEGGFTEDEIAVITDAGGTAVSLGPRRLRAETAGIAAAVAVQEACASVHSPHSL